MRLGCLVCRRESERLVLRWVNKGERAPSLLPVCSQSDRWCFLPNPRRLSRPGTRRARRQCSRKCSFMMKLGWSSVSSQSGCSLNSVPLLVQFSLFTLRTEPQPLSVQPGRTCSNLPLPDSCGASPRRKRPLADAHGRTRAPVAGWLVGAFTLSSQPGVYPRKGRFPTAAQLLFNFYLKQSRLINSRPISAPGPACADVMDAVNAAQPSYTHLNMKSTVLNPSSSRGGSFLFLALPTGSSSYPVAHGASERCLRGSGG